MKKNSSLGFTTLLFLILLFLKLGQFGVVANWSWWWVTAPLWIPISLLFIAVFIYAVCIDIKYFINNKFNK